MKAGGVLLLDEIDLASNKIMCLQPILEGNGVLLKKINQFVEPVEGFQIVATANTKGKGSDDGRFVGTGVIAVGKEDEDFADKLVKWADIIRKTFMDGGIDELIATRRLVHIVKAYSVFGDRMKAIQMCINRFDDETKSAFIDLYTKVDADIVNTEVGESEIAPKEDVDKTPF